jgi:hypothetical protein
MRGGGPTPLAARDVSMSLLTETAFIHDRVYNLPKLHYSINLTLEELREKGAEILDIKLTSYGEGANATVLAMVIYRRDSGAEKEPAHE